MENQGTGTPPPRPPPPTASGPPPPYGDPQAGPCPGGQPGMLGQCDAPPPYAPAPYQGGYPPPGGYMPQDPPQGYAQGPPQGFHLSSPPQLYPDISQLPQPEAGTVPLPPHGNSMNALRSSLLQHPSACPLESLDLGPDLGLDLAPTAPPELPPSYEESLAPSHHLDLLGGVTTGHNYYCREPLTLPGSSLALVNTANPSSYDKAASCTNSGSKPDAFSNGGQEIRNGNLPIDPRGPQPGFGPNVAPPVGAPGVPPSPTAPSRVPVRPAPCPPIHIPSAPSSGLDQPPWWANLRDGEAPPSCVISWKGAEGLKIYFIQEEGHVVSPKKPLGLTLYKKIKGRSDVVEESLLGMIEVAGCWRLRLHGKDSFCLHTFNDTYIFLDDSTCPSKSGRIVIMELPQDVSKTMRSDLLALLQEMADLREEQEGVVDKITTNVGAVYEDITKKINLAVKDAVPGAHKSTKWIRKGTGSLVRMGGNLVSKGLHMIADHAPASQPEKEEESPIHSALLEGLRKFQRDLESKMITYVD